ncbi:class F sortase [Williamsia soli]|uniref:class F sortase n=1 Tax=Williamsia soli TaxID=364929 RepID=UPI001A9E2DA2|nr:class F sortase [Williamsia soli]
MRTQTRARVIVPPLAALAAAFLISACSDHTDSNAAPQAAEVLSGSTASAEPKTAAVGEPLHISVPSVSIDARVNPIDGGAEGIDPPNNDDAWWWTGRGEPGSADTVYVAGHAIDTGDGVFTPLHEVAPGAEIRLDTTAGSRSYVVQATVVYDKADLERYDEVWSAIPGRLVLVTCHLDEGHTTDDNYVVFASLVS